jgi:hypothetical protein
MVWVNINKNLESLVNNETLMNASILASPPHICRFAFNHLYTIKIKTLKNLKKLKRLKRISMHLCLSQKIYDVENVIP